MAVPSLEFIITLYEPFFISGHTVGLSGVSKDDNYTLRVTELY